MFVVSLWWPSDTIWRYRTRLPLVYLMIWCLTAARLTTINIDLRYHHCIVVLRAISWGILKISIMKICCKIPIPIRICWIIAHWNLPRASPWITCQYHTEYYDDKDIFDGLVQDCSNSSALAMELLQSCTKPSYWYMTMLSIILSSFWHSDIDSCWVMNTATCTIDKILQAFMVSRS